MVGHDLSETLVAPSQQHNPQLAGVAAEGHEDPTALTVARAIRRHQSAIRRIGTRKALTSVSPGQLLLCDIKSGKVVPTYCTTLHTVGLERAAASRIVNAAIRVDRVDTHVRGPTVRGSVWAGLGGALVNVGVAVFPGPAWGANALVRVQLVNADVIRARVGGTLIAVSCAVVPRIPWGTIAIVAAHQVGAYPTVVARS